MNSINFNGTQVIPSKVICIGRNYAEHIEELGNEMPDNMVIFNKPNSAITDKLKYFGTECRFEGEICLLIRGGEIAGLGLGLDLTRADIQNICKKKGLPWERAKSFDGSAVFSDFIEYNGDISNIGFELFINDQLTQKADYSLMMHKPKEMLQEIGSFMTLEDNDIVMTGTPKGVGNYKVGDRFTMRLFEKGRILLESEWKAV